MKIKKFTVAVTLSLCLATRFYSYAGSGIIVPEIPMTETTQASVEKTKDEVIQDVKQQILQNVPESSLENPGYITLSSKSDMNIIISKMFRYCSPFSFYYPSDDLNGVYSLDGKCLITDEALYILSNYQTKTQEIVSQKISGIIPNGLSYYEAADALYKYMLNRYDYAAEGRTSLKITKLYQSAYPSLETGLGMCSSLSFLYRAYFENIPFDPVTGLVNYNSETPVYHTIYISYNPEHVWITVPAFNGLLYDYDLTFGEYNASKWMRKSHEWMSQQKSHLNPQLYM